MSTITLLCIALAGVIMLLLLVIKAKVQPFVALLLVSLLVALAAGIPAGEVGKVMIAGMGGVLGSVTIIIGLGAMLGRMIEHSGGAESLANYFSRKLGDKRTIAALTLAAFFLGIPVFFDVGFIILAPIIYGFAKVAKISPLKFGLPVAGIMLTVHVAVPPHPGPVAAAVRYRARYKGNAGTDIPSRHLSPAISPSLQSVHRHNVDKSSSSPYLRAASIAVSFSAQALVSGKSTTGWL